MVDEGFNVPVQSDTSHPMHLHGTSFAVLSVKKLGEPIKIDEIIEMDKNGLLERNLNKPPIKDTVIVPKNGKF